MSYIAGNRGHFAPVINCQRNLIFKMADKSDRSQGKRIPYDVLNNLSSVDLFYEEKSKKKTSSKKILGIYQAERLIARKQDADVSKTAPTSFPGSLFSSSLGRWKGPREEEKRDPGNEVETALHSTFVTFSPVASHKLKPGT